MRHYEIVFLVHPDQSEQTQSVLNKFSSIVTESEGIVHRLENIGKRKLAYPIQDQFKASYALMNVECNNEAIEEIKSSFKFNDSIIRELVLVKNKAFTEQSNLFLQTNEEDQLEDHTFKGIQDKNSSIEGVREKTSKEVEKTDQQEEE